MTTHSRGGLALMLGLLAGLFLLAELGAQAPEQKKDVEKKDAAKDTAATPVKAKPLSDNVKKGLAYLANQQHASGGWGQGGGWRTAKEGGRIEGGEVADPPDVASTAMATLAFLRAGHTPKSGEYAKVVAKAIEFIESHIEKADKDSLYVTDIRGTQVQSKIGPYVDTFLAALVLAEAKGKMPDQKSEDRLVASLDRVITKIEKNQKADGTFEGNVAWASVFSQCMCAKGLNRAKQMGARVNDAALQNAENNALALFDKDKREFKSTTGGTDALGGGGRVASSGPGKSAGSVGGVGGPAAGFTDAGVPVYNQASNTIVLQESLNTYRQREKAARDVLAKKDATKEEKEKAQKELDGVESAAKAVEETQRQNIRALTTKLGDDRFIAGFGSNGGEEFLSYMNISETLVVKGGKEWEDWDKKMAENLNRIQNGDGSWSGHHCITGRTFCTSSALLVLMADRAPVPVAAKVKEGK